MLGVTNPNSNRVAVYALATFLLVFFVNFVYDLYMLLPDIPTETELYASFIRALFTALAIYCINKGVQWQRNSEGS